MALAAHVSAEYTCTDAVGGLVAGFEPAQRAKTPAKKVTAVWQQAHDGSRGYAPPEPDKETLTLHAVVQPAPVHGAPMSASSLG